MTDKKTYEFFMGEALKQAKLSFEADEVPIGAVLVHQNKIMPVLIIYLLLTMIQVHMQKL